MRTTEVAELLEVSPTSVPRYARRAGLEPSIGGAHWSPGDALAMLTLRQLGGSARFAEGCRKVGEAIDNGYPPAYLVTRGGPENVAVIEAEDPAVADELVVELLAQASDAGAAVRVVKLRTMVRRLDPWLRELIDA